MNHNQLYETALTAATELQRDTSVSLETALASLKSLRNEIVILMDVVETDIGQREAAKSE